MKVLIMSDSHGLTHEISMITDRHKHEVGTFIHCGDSELLKKESTMRNLVAVRGNCDRDSSYPDTIVKEITDKTFFITHGHLYNVKRDLLNLSYKGEETNANIICFGHTHVAGSELINGKLYLNPGSIYLSRGRKEKTYAILDIVHNQITTAFYDIQGNRIEALNKTYQIG